MNLYRHRHHRGLAHVQAQRAGDQVLRVRTVDQQRQLRAGRQALAHARQGHVVQPQAAQRLQLVVHQLDQAARVDDTGADKDEALLPYRDTGCWWVEDKYTNALLGHNLGLRSLLMEHGHNMDADVVFPKVKNWKEIYELIVRQ